MEIKDFTIFGLGVAFLVLSVLTSGIVFYAAFGLTVLIILADLLWLLYQRVYLSRVLVIRRSISKYDVFLGTAFELLTIFEYAGKKPRVISVEQPMDPEITVVREIAGLISLSSEGPVSLPMELKPNNTGEMLIRPMRILNESYFFRDSIKIGRQEKINVHIGVGSTDARSSRSFEGSHKFSDFIRSNLIETRGGTDFSTIRNYLPGDDSRSIDWARSSRSGTLVVREYEEDRQMPVFFAVDVDRSMGLGTTTSELTSGTNLIALLINKITMDSNLFGLACFSRSDVTVFKSMGIGRDHLSKVRKILTGLRPEEGSTVSLANDVSLFEASSARKALLQVEGVDVLGSVLDETIREYAVNISSDGFTKAIMKISRSVDKACQIVVVTNLSMGMASLLNGVRIARYYGHSVSVVLTPHIWYDDKEMIDAETCYDRYRKVKDLIAGIKGSGSVKVIDLSASDRPEDAIYRSSTYRQSTGLRRW